MYLETFLYDHITVVTFALLAALIAAQSKRLIDGWHYLAGCGVVATGATYLNAVHDGFSVAMVVNLVTSLVLWTLVYRQRPKRKVPDGTHEAL